MTDFFEAGKEYDDATPWKAPEMTRVFQCVHVAEFPGTGEKIAFGFMRNAGDANWGGTGMGPAHWDRDTWNVCG